MAQISLVIPLIQETKYKEFVLYLDSLRQSVPDVTICQSLLDAVDHEDLPPYISSIFLSWSASPDTIALSILNGRSQFLRKQGIKQFGKALARHEQWETAWAALGGTKGLVDLFAKVSVVEVKLLSRAIGRCNQGQQKIHAREKAVEELLCALLPSHYNSRSIIQSYDKRPISHHYAHMVPACSVEFVKQLLDAKDPSNPLYLHLPASRLTKTHEELLRKRLVDSICGNQPSDRHVERYLNTFLYSQPPRPEPDTNVSASMALASKILQFRLGDIDNEKWPPTVSEANVLLSLLGRSLKRKFPEAEVHRVIMLGLKLLEAKPQLKLTFQSSDMWNKVIYRWKKDPVLYDNLIAMSLRLGLSGSDKAIGKTYLETSHWLEVKQELRWPLLRLYCLHLPNTGVDIDTASDFTPIAKQTWPSDLFYHLNKAQAAKLLQGLYNACGKRSLLVAPAGTSILSSSRILSQQNFNVELLLTILQRDSEQIQNRAQEAVGDLRKRAAGAKEQQDRAQLAKAATHYAIASGNLDLYREAVIWQQRYIRDPLTVKVIFGRDAVMTDEGIELLSAIPQPLPDDVSLNEIAMNVAKANEIFKIFHETMLLARREPSFHQPDWAGVTSLFGSAIQRRVNHSEDVQKHLHSPDANVYAEIWDGTLAMLESVSVDFLNQAYAPIRHLLSKLPPTPLAATTKAMLEAGNNKRKSQERQLGDDILERLSYDALVRLANSEKPELAQRLVLETIINRPDASSWHRQLLSISFMNSLPSKDAHQMLLVFATAIGEKLEEQSYVKVGEPQQTTSAPLVKVTTVKYLAQLLDNAEFISADAAIEILLELFKAGTHRDIRLATLDSLLSLLSNLCSGTDENWRSNSLVEQILDALETVIPVVGSVNERYPPRQQDWEEARESKTLPDISDISTGPPPLLNALLIAPFSPQYRGLKVLRAEFVSRFLLPALRQSQAEHRKWIALFLQKYRATFSLDALPQIPITPSVWVVLLGNYADLIPEVVLEDYNSYLVMRIAPPAILMNFNKKLKNNTDVSNTAEVRHWLTIFDQRIVNYSASGTHTLVHMIHHSKPNPAIPNGITFPKVLDMVTIHASLFLDRYEDYIDVWNDFVKDLRHPTKATVYPQDTAHGVPSMALAWQKTGRLLLERVADLVVDKRNRALRNQNRSIFPSDILLRLWLLPYPSSASSTELDHQCKAFANEMERLLGSFLSVEANVLRWPKVAADTLTVSELFNTPEERLCVASYIGKLTGSRDGTRDLRSSVLNYVRLGLALELIENGTAVLKRSSRVGVPDELRERLKKMAAEWESDVDEDIREKVAEWEKQNQDLWETVIEKSHLS